MVRNRVAALGGLIASLVSPPLAAADIAILTDPSVAPYVQTVAGIRGRGGSIVQVDIRSSGAVSEVRGSNPVVVVAVGQQALVTARRSFADLPIVFANVLAPQQYGLGANVTGVPLEVGAEAQLRGIHELLPSVRRVGIVYNPSIFAAFVADTRGRAGALGLEIVEARVGSAREVQAAVQRLLGSADALLLLPDPSLWSRDTLSFTLLQGLERRKPVIGFLDALTQSGALLSFAPDYGAIGARARELVDRILTQPRDRPAQVPPLAYARGRASLNMSTATRVRARMPADAERRVQRVFR
ncbi:MAG: hypothetical protein HYY06_23015 [Deltaproteobacteria bacterium]|nr:hypothetical protein [Deltaproteobacteria bacterium]